MFDLNQFTIAPVAGDYFGAPNRPMLQVKNAGETPLKTGMVVSVADFIGKMLGVTASAVTDTKIAGVVVRSFNKDTWNQNEVCMIARAGDMIWLDSTAAAITAGSLVEFNTDGKVLASAGTNTVIGRAWNSVPAAGGLVCVEIIAPYAPQVAS